MLDFRMDTFIEVCKYMNYTKAAEALCITQPAVSQHIRVLEEYYGVRLFKYEGKNLMLTEDGQILKQVALREKHDEEYLKDKLQRKNAKKRTVRFGTTLTIGEYVIPSIISDYLKKEKDNNIHMMIANTHELINKLDNSEIDFAIVEGYFEKENYESRILRNERYVCVRGKDYPMHRHVKNIKDILKETIVVREEGSGTREIFERFLSERNYQIKDFSRLIEINNMQAIKCMVSSGCGISFLYEIAVLKELKEGTLQEVLIKDFNISHEFTFIWQKGSIFSDEYEKIYEMLVGNLARDSEGV